eukprot:7388854-Prymnesium_polylepis.1
MLASLVAAATAQTPRLLVHNGGLYLDDLQGAPHFFRAVQYSPAPWGPADNDLKFKTDYYASHWPALFDRDMEMVSLMGANAVRIDGWFGTSSSYNTPHTTFLNAAHSRNISVLLSYDLVGRGVDAVSLVTQEERDAVAASFRSFLLAAKHEATVLVFLGDSVNRYEAGFVCNEARDSGGFKTFNPCQFGEDVDAFAAALDALCQQAVDLGIACSVPMANLPLPTFTPSGLQRSEESRGVLDWLELLDAGAPSVGVLSASLAASNDSSEISFEIDLSALPLSLNSTKPCAAERRAGART